MPREDDEPAPAASAKARLQPLALDSLGIAELEAYIQELRQEISRVEVEIRRKEGHRTNADAVFRRP